MKRYLVRLLSSALLLTGMGFTRSRGLLPGWSIFFHPQQNQPTASDLIKAINDLRLAHGIPPLTVNPILMHVAQSQADFLLQTGGSSGHTRANGMDDLTEQLLSLGYPLAGDLSLGGYRSENFGYGTAMDIQGAIQFWKSDDPHSDTMLSTNYNDIGAGLAIGSDGSGYYVIDTARHTASGKQQDDYTPPAGETMISLDYDPELAGTTVSSVIVNGTPGVGQDTVDEFMVPVALSTPNSDGLVIHEVKNGQSLWSIAIAYKTTVQQIRDLNNLSSDDIFTNQKLLIRRESPPTPASPLSPEQAAIIAPTFVPVTLSYPARTATPAPLFPGSDPNKDNPSLIAVTILVALSFAGFGFWANKGRS